MPYKNHQPDDKVKKQSGMENGFDNFKNFRKRKLGVGYDNSDGGNYDSYQQKHVDQNS